MSKESRNPPKKPFFGDKRGTSIKPFFGGGGAASRKPLFGAKKALTVFTAPTPLYDASPAPCTPPHGTAPARRNSRRA
jgi:hypothetical protein